MKRNNLIYHDEVDLIALFKIIWEGKIKIIIITIILSLLGFGYSHQIPDNYSNSLTISLNDNYELKQLDNIRKLIKSIRYNKLNQSNQPNQSNQSNQLDKINYIILDKYIDELKDYEEFLFSLKNTIKINEDIQKFKSANPEIELFKYAKLLNVHAPKKNTETGILEESFVVNFIWNDLDEAKKVLNDTLGLTLNNLQKDISYELKQSFEFEKKLILSEDMKKLDYLKEQSIIAKELNISDNQIDNLNLSQPSLSLNINTADIAFVYYLRGYKAIDKEIDLIKNRDYQNLEFIDQEIKKLGNTEMKLIDYNIHLMESKSLKKSTMLILIISIFLGLIIGTFYVLILRAFQSEITSKK